MPSPSVPDRRSRPLATLGLALASTLLALALGEAAARRLLSGAGKEGLEGQRYTEFDPLLGWHKIPGARVTYRRREYTVEVVINSRGLRDRERPYEAPRGVRRVLALGDSFLEGYTVPFEDTLTQVLETELNGTGCPTEVLNAGTLAYSTDQEFLFYKSEGRRYRPQLVLLFLYYNDVLYNDLPIYFGRSKPLLDTAHGAPRLARAPIRPGSPRSPPVERPAPEGPTRARGSVLARALREQLAARAPELDDRLARLRLWRPRVRRLPRLEQRVYAARLEPELEHAWATTAALLRALRLEVEADGAQLVVVYVPSRMEVHDDAWSATLRASLGTEGWRREAVIARLRQVALKGGYLTIDLTPALRAVDRGWGRRPYFISDGHWTALGHRTAAQAVFQALRAQGLLGCAAP